MIPAGTHHTPRSGLTPRLPEGDIPAGITLLITLLLDVAVLLLALSGAALVAWWRAREEVRNSFAQAHNAMADMLERARISLSTAQEAIDESAARASRERARVEQAERRAAAREAPPAPAPRQFDARSYKRHLERGGRRDPNFEQTLTGGGNG